MLRLVGGLLLMGSGVGSTLWLCGRAATALRQVEGLIALLRQIRLQVTCFSMPASAILARSDPSLLRQCGYGGEGPPGDFAELVRESRILDPSAEEIFLDFGTDFGLGYREEQGMRCEYSIERLEERRRELAAQLPSRKKLYSTLCMSGALALMILFL